MLKKIISAAALSAVLSLPCIAQKDYAITGFIVDSDGRPIERALITLDVLPFGCKGCLDILTLAAYSDETGFFLHGITVKPGQRLGLYVIAPVPTDYFPLKHFFEGNADLPRELHIKEFTVSNSKVVDLGKVRPILDFRKVECGLRKLNGEPREGFRSVKFGIATLAGIEIAAPIPAPKNFWPNSQTVRLAMPIGKVLLKVESETKLGSSKVSYFRLDKNGVFQPFQLRGKQRNRKLR